MIPNCCAANPLRSPSLMTVLRGSETYVPTVDDVEILRNQLAIAAEDAPKPVRKALAQAFVHELRVEERNEVRPTFQVHRQLPLRAATAGPGGSRGGGVRTMTRSLEAKVQVRTEQSWAVIIRTPLCCWNARPSC